MKSNRKVLEELTLRLNKGISINDFHVGQVVRIHLDDPEIEGNPMIEIAIAAIVNRASSPSLYFAPLSAPIGFHLSADAEETSRRQVPWMEMRLLECTVQKQKWLAVFQDETIDDMANVPCTITPVTK